MPAQVLIAGAGVAALEAALALRSLAADRVEVELLGAEHHFWYRPLSVTEPFARGEATRYELPALAVAAGARFTPGTLLGVDAPHHEAKTSVGDIQYDFLVVAVGALPSPAVAGAVTFRGPADREKLESMLDDVVVGRARRIAFAVPDGAVWPLPLYELALLTAAYAAQNGIEPVELTLATPEAAPAGVRRGSEHRGAPAARGTRGLPPVRREPPSRSGTAGFGCSPIARSMWIMSSLHRACAAPCSKASRRPASASSRSTRTRVSRAARTCTRPGTSSTFR